MLQLARRALASAMDSSESPSYNPDPRILGNLYISSISLVAILLGSKTSLKIWRALQVHDNLTKGGKDIPASACKSKHRKTAALALTFFILAFFSFEGTWIYGLIAEDAIAARVGAGALTAFIASVCLTQPLIDCVADLHVTRWAGKKGNHYIARSIPAHRKRAIFAAVTGLSIAIYQAIAPSSGIFSAMMTGLVYRYASRPSPIYKGWLSIRGMVIMLGSMMVLMVVLTASLVFAIVQTGSVGNASGKKDTFGMTDDDDMGMQGLQLNGISLHILNGLIGMLIALVFRYEFSLTDFPVQLNVSNGSSSAEAEPLLVDEKKDEVNPQSDSIPTPSQRITVTVFNIPKFRAPLFALSLGTLALVHVPALLLTSSASSWVTKVMTEDGGSFASIASFILVEMPPQVWGAIFVPLVVILATYLREDGCQLWRYSEQWVIVKEKETSAANADVENTVTPTPTPVNASVDVKEGELVDVKA